MSLRYMLDARGEPVPCEDVREWGRFMDEPFARTVGATDVGTAHVSTVFLGLDHRTPFGVGPVGPVLWETLVFGGPLAGELWRWESLALAVRGHWAAVQEVAEAMGVDLSRFERRLESDVVGVTRGGIRRMDL